MEERRSTDSQINQLELKIVQGFTEAKEQRKSHSAQIKRIDTSINKITDSIYGNGKKGLIAEVVAIQTFQTSTIWGISTGITLLLGVLAFISM